MTAIVVLPIPAEQAHPFLLHRHYAKRLCPISFAFGAYRGTDLIGVVTYGTPASAPLRTGIAGPEWAPNVLELNRLCCETTRNVASQLVGASLRMLPKPALVVSFADIGQGHVGYIYQACNFTYTGLSALRTDWKVRGLEHLHGATIADKSRGKVNRGQWMRNTYGDDFYLSPRDRKHRYVYFVGTRKQASAMRSALRYPTAPYPKGDSARYDADATIHTQSRLDL